MAAKSKKKTAPKKSAPRRRRKKDTVDETVEQNSMSLLLGNQPPTRDMLYHWDNIAGWMDRVKTAQGKLSDAKKKAKEAGIDVPTLLDTMSMLRMDPLELATKLRQQATLMHEKGLPIQIQLFEPKYGSVDEQAGKEGFNDGLAPRSPNVERWKEGQPGHEIYMRRWNDAQRQNAEAIKKTPQSVD